MNIVQFFKNVSDVWNEENKCGFCWNFSAPLSESSMNEYTPTNDKKCCVNLFITNYTTSNGYKLAQAPGINIGATSLDWCDHIFTLYVVKNAEIGLNTYNEQPNHDVEESLWSTILDPLQNCLGCGNEIDLCDFGNDFEIIKWNMEAVKYKDDSNYTGWKIMGIFRQYK